MNTPPNLAKSFLIWLQFLLDCPKPKPPPYTNQAQSITYQSTFPATTKNPLSPPLDKYIRLHQSQIQRERGQEPPLQAFNPPKALRFTIRNQACAAESDANTKIIVCLVGAWSRQPVGKTSSASAVWRNICLAS